jgi:hypothetical protein
VKGVWGTQLASHSHQILEYSAFNNSNIFMTRWPHTGKYCHDVCGLWENYKTRFGLDDWIYCTLYIQNSGLPAIQRYRYSTHFIFRRYHKHYVSQSSRVVSWQRIYNRLTIIFNSLMKTSSHNLIHFLLLLHSHLRLPPPELDPILDNSLNWNFSTSDN